MPYLASFLDDLQIHNHTQVLFDGMMGKHNLIGYNIKTSSFCLNDESNLFIGSLYDLLENKYLVKYEKAFREDEHYEEDMSYVASEELDKLYYFEFVSYTAADIDKNDFFKLF